MTTKEIIISYINKSLMMLNDVNSFIFLRSKSGTPILKKNNLGGGNHLSLIGQFAILNFLAKIYLVLSKGRACFVEQDKIDEIKEEKKKIDKKLRAYVKNPRLGEIDETQAFIFLIMQYPVDLGIPKNEETIKKIWDDFRNKISHIATLERDNIAMTFEYIGLEYPVIQKTILSKQWDARPFILLDPKRREELRAEILKDDPKLENFLSKIKYQATNNFVYVDFLNMHIYELAEWIIEKINNETFTKDQLSDTKTWLDIQFNPD